MRTKRAQTKPRNKTGKGKGQKIMNKKGRTEGKSPKNPCSL